MGTHSAERTAKVVKNLSTFVPRVRSIRTYGSAGINLAYLAMGAVDAYFEMASRGNVPRFFGQRKGEKDNKNWYC